MLNIKYIFICKEYTICSGIKNHDIETTLKELVLNRDALEALDLISVICNPNKPKETFEWYCGYLAQFVSKESEERKKFNLTNPTIQILCSGELLNKLKSIFNE